MEIKFSRAGRIKYWVLKHILGIDILELIFGGHMRKGRRWFGGYGWPEQKPNLDGRRFPLKTGEALLLFAVVAITVFCFSQLLLNLLKGNLGAAIAALGPSLAGILILCYVVFRRLGSIGEYSG